MFARLGPWCYDRRKLILLVWILALFALNGVATGAGDKYREDLNLPDVESRDGFDLLDDRFGGQGTGYTGTIVFEAEQGVDDPEVEAAMSELFEMVAGLDDVTRVDSPYAEGGEQLISSRGDSAGRIAYANVELPEESDFARAAEIRDTILDESPEIDGLRIELGGFIFADFEEPTSELIGLAFAIVILIAAFGSVLAMGLPIGVALFGIGLGGALTILLSHILTIPQFAPFIGVMIGLGVGIDYALLIITRYREQLHDGHGVRDSIGMAMDTAGRSVLFAGVTVVISLLGMLLIGVPFVAGLAVSASVTVAITVIASLTLLPALVGLAGDRIELTRRRGLIAAALIAVGLVGVGAGITALTVAFPIGLLILLLGSADELRRFAVWTRTRPPQESPTHRIGRLVVTPLGLLAGVIAKAVTAPSRFLRTEVAHRPPKPRRETLAYRWSRIIQHRPWRAALVGTAVLLLLAAPVLGLRLGFSDESNFPEDTSTKQAYDLLVEGFGEGFNGQMLLVADLGDDGDPAALEAVNEAVEADPGVVFVSPPRTDDPDAPTAAVWSVIPTSGPQAEATTELVERLRSDVLPGAEEAIGTDVLVSGATAVNVDFADFLAERILYFFAAVLVLSFVFLMVVFRSLLVPLKAVIMNLLSIGAAYGVMVALFQWAWLSDLTNVAPAPVEPWMPMMLFAIVFGLSMDYEVFLLSRVREEWTRTGDSRTSVADGLAATAKVITAAAAIMVVVFGSFLLESDRTFKLMGTGLATAIFLDATIVRMLLVPATMELLGDRNWWLPTWLDRLLPNIDVEGRREAGAPPTDAPGADEDDEREPALTH
ncbi:MAG TPA: MMPL family transporter [Acidimicrobiales bacterium]|nr:MMPL family transporter [Acidimicrobiales bacterium]